MRTSRSAVFTYRSQPARKTLLSSYDRRKLSSAEARARRNLAVQRLNANSAYGELGRRGSFRNYAQAQFEYDRLTEAKDLARVLAEAKRNTR